MRPIAILTSTLAACALLLVADATVFAQAPKPKGAAPEAPPGNPGTKSAVVPSYFVIPLQGAIGKEVIASKVKEAMQAGLKDPKTILVLEVDSPGGLISECEAILNILASEKDRRSVAFVKNALSAAAILALTCDEIYMHEDSVIGDAQAITLKTPQLQESTPQTKPQPGQPRSPRRRAAPEPEPKKDSPETPPSEEEKDEKKSDSPISVAPEKFQSYWRALCRRAAEVGGHNPLVAEGMAEVDMQLRVVEKDGKKVIEQFLTLRDEDFVENRVIKPKGKLLTLTAKEAVQHGVAVQTVRKLTDIEVVNPDLIGWKQSSHRGRAIMSGYSKDLAKAEKSLDQLITSFTQLLHFAAATDPADVPLVTDVRGDPTVAARGQFIRTCTAHAGHLTMCDQALKKIVRIGAQYPALGVSPKALEKQQDFLTTLRQRMRAEAKRWRVSAAIGPGL